MLVYTNRSQGDCFGAALYSGFRGQTIRPRANFGQIILPGLLLAIAAATRNQAFAAPPAGKGMVPARKNYDSSHTFTRLAPTKPWISIFLVISEKTGISV
jgi:hypothetical protein